MINIVHLSNPIGGDKGGGVRTVVKDYMLYKHPNNFKVDLWYPGSNDYEKEIKGFAAFTDRLKLLGLIGKSNSRKIYLPQILRELKNIDIIHQHSLWLLPSALSAIFSNIKKGKVIIQPHGALSPHALKRSSHKKYIARLLYEANNMRNAYMFIANSLNELTDIKRLFPFKEVALIPHGVPEGFINHPPVNRPNFDSCLNGKRGILFLSRIHPIKGLERLIIAVSRMGKMKIGNVVFIIAGYGEDNYLKYLKATIKRYEIDRYFIFTGNANLEDKIALLDRCSGFILPSHTESFSIAIVEALARGVPVITTKGAPWPELVDFDCGLWVENSTEGLVKGLSEYIEKTEAELSRMRGNAKRLVISRYILENNISKYEELYKYITGHTTKPKYVY